MRIKTFTAVGMTLVLLAGLGMSGAAAFTGANSLPSVVVASAPLTDLKAGADPLDGASARVTAIASHGRTRVILFVTGISPRAVGMTFGSHVHIGPCVAGNGKAAKGHFNIGGPPSASTEVWLDFKVRAAGIGVSQTTVPFVIPSGGAQSVVIHEFATLPGGVAGARLACLPVAF